MSLWLFSLLVGDHDLERACDLSQRYAGVLLPSFEVVCGVDEDDEVLIFAFVVDFGDVDVSTRHVVLLIGVDWEGDWWSRDGRGVMDWLLLGSRA